MTENLYRNRGVGLNFNMEIATTVVYDTHKHKVLTQSMYK